jgi:hypothetical protein
MLVVVAGMLHLLRQTQYLLACLLRALLNPILKQFNGRTPNEDTEHV